MIIRIDVPRECNGIDSDSEVANCFWVDVHDKDGFKKAISEIKDFMTGIDEIPQIEIRTGLFFVFEINVVHIFEDILGKKLHKVPQVETIGGLKILTLR